MIKKVSILLSTVELIQNIHFVNSRNNIVRCARAIEVPVCKAVCPCREKEEELIIKA